MWVPVLLPLLGPLIHYSRLISLSLSPAITEEGSPSKQKIPIARTYSIHSSSKKTSSKTHSKKNPKSKPIKLNQQEHDKTKKKKKKRDPLKKKLKPTGCKSSTIIIGATKLKNQNYVPNIIFFFLNFFLNCDFSCETKTMYQT
jgi:hypothetical protein